MSEFKGTKGEWTVKNKTNGFESYIHVGNMRICEIKYYPNKIGEWEKDPTKEEGEANAKLISKAPQLLELLNHFVKISDELSAPDYLIETYANLYANAFNIIQEATTI